MLTRDAPTIARALAVLPIGFRAGGGRAAARTFEILVFGTDRAGLRIDGNGPGRDATLGAVLEALADSLETFASTHSETHAFLHAGAVEVGGRAIVLPGRSHAGKSTLVKAFLDRGARYLSDDMVPIDAGFRAHPFARPLMLRAEAGGTTRPVLPEQIGARAAEAAVEIAAVVCIRFDAAVQDLRLEEKTGAAAFAELLAHAPGARIRPNVIVPILAGVARQTPVFVGARGEAAAAADALLARVSAA